MKTPRKPRAPTDKPKAYKAPRKLPKPKREPPKLDIVEHKAGGTVQSVGTMVRAGMDKQTHNDAVKTYQERGRLRGGNAGAVIDYDLGKYAGNCARATMARYLGADAPHDPDKWRNTRLMLDNGRLVEAGFIDSLVLGLPAGHTIKQDKEYPILADIKAPPGFVDTNGNVVDHIPFTGRTDVTLFDASGKPYCVVELKNLSSIPYDVVYGEKPKFGHLIQLANYMRLTGCVGQLWYTLRVKFPIPQGWSFVDKLLPESSDANNPGAEHTEWKWKVTDRGTIQVPAAITPHMIGFHLKFDDTGVLYYTRASDTDPSDKPTIWARTGITKQGIADYYESILVALHERELPPKNSTYDVDGSSGKFNPCLFCDWEAVCESAGKSYDDWEDMVLNQVIKE